MLKKSWLVVLFTLVLLGAGGCSGSVDEQDPDQAKPALKLTPNAPLKELIPGVWTMDSLHITLNALSEDPDSQRIIKANRALWRLSYGYQPHRSIFYPNNRYSQRLNDTTGRLANREVGTWETRPDTLVLFTYDDNTNLIRTPYHVSRVDSGLRLQAMLDFDGDGQQDDRYVSWTHKIQLPPDGPEE